MNACVVAGTNALNAAAGGSAYFEFALTPASGCTLTVTNLAFGTRCTATGPQLFCVRSSVDGYAADLATGVIAADSAWVLKNVSLATTSTVPGAAVTFRIYGYGGSGNVTSSANWRIDDLAVDVYAEGSVNATPPVIAQVSGQSVRVGQAMTFPLAIAPTDGDPVTVTNATASAGVVGAWSLASGVFSYTPALTDLGARTFTFTAADKDGTNTMTVAVTVLRAQVAAVRMAGASGSYAQDFNALATNGTDTAWDNAAEPLEAWYAYENAVAITAYRTGTGTATSGGLYSFGSGATSSDRSLGSLAGSGDLYRYGVAFTNETGLAITNLTVSFTAEQWRVGANALTNTLSFETCVTNRVLPLNQGVWRSMPALGFASPAVTGATQSAGAIYLSDAKSATLTRPVPAGAVVLLRWSDPDDAGADHAFGIDDLSVTWSAGALPEAISVGRAGVTENFNDLGADAGAELPCLWRVESRDDVPRVSGAYAAASDRTTYANAVVDFTHAGSYNYASSVAGDQAVGGLSSASAAKCVTLFAKFTNACGLPLRRWTVRYAVEKYRNGQTSCAVCLLASTDGATWAAAGAPTPFAADADNSGYAADARPGAAVGVERKAAFAERIAPDGVFYLAWQIAVAEGSSTADAQALGIDDVQVLPDYPSGTVIWVQ
jgi:hypothetical protein